MEDFGEKFAEQARAYLAKVHAFREKYLRAWIAETGMKPTECTLVEKRLPDGTLRMWVEPRHVDDVVNPPTKT